MGWGVYFHLNKLINSLDFQQLLESSLICVYSVCSGSLSKYALQENFDADFFHYLSVTCRSNKNKQIYTRFNIIDYSCVFVK